MEKTFQTGIMVVGVFLLTMLVAVGGTFLYQNRNASINLPTLSDEDEKAIKDPKAANKAAYDKMSREAWENAKKVQPQPGWDRGWKK
jgi:hypothetical protein